MQAHDGGDDGVDDVGILDGVVDTRRNGSVAVVVIVVIRVRVNEMRNAPARRHAGRIQPRFAPRTALVVVHGQRVQLGRGEEVVVQQRGGEGGVCRPARYGD